MASKLKLFVVFALLALVPLRALAAVSTGLCAMGEGGVAVAEHHHHHHGAAGDETSPEGDAKNTLTCSLCTACCTGASLAPDAPRVLRAAGADLERIPFFGRDPATGVPARFDRPPLSL